MKCPFCDSLHTLKDGYDDDSMDIWRCMACGETFTQSDLDKAKDEPEQLPLDGFGNLLKRDDNGWWIYP